MPQFDHGYSRTWDSTAADRLGLAGFGFVLASCELPRFPPCANTCCGLLRDAHNQLLFTLSACLNEEGYLFLEMCIREIERRGKWRWFDVVDWDLSRRLGMNDIFTNCVILQVSRKKAYIDCQALTPSWTNSFNMHKVIYSQYLWDYLWMQSCLCTWLCNAIVSFRLDWMKCWLLCVIFLNVIVENSQYIFQFTKQVVKSEITVMTH